MTCSSGAFVSTIDGSPIEVPSEFICPLTLGVMVHPLTTKGGLNFERSAILAWLSQGTGRCPLTRNPMQPSSLIPNRSLEARIWGWRKANQVPFPSPEELEETKYDFVGFLKVSENKRSQILARTSLVSMADPVMMSRQRVPMANMEPGGDASVTRQPGERRRNFLSRILTAATDELENL